VEWRGNRAVSGIAALSGQGGPVWSPLRLAQPVPRSEILQSADDIGSDWAGGLPPFATTAGAGDAYCRHAARVMARRAIERICS
jgi:hypothetical protein